MGDGERTRWRTGALQNPSPGRGSSGALPLVGLQKKANWPPLHELGSALWACSFALRYTLIPFCLPDPSPVVTYGLCFACQSPPDAERVREETMINGERPCPWTAGNICAQSKRRECKKREGEARPNLADAAVLLHHAVAAIRQPLQSEHAHRVAQPVLAQSRKRGQTAARSNRSADMTAVMSAAGRGGFRFRETNQEPLW